MSKSVLLVTMMAAAAHAGEAMPLTDLSTSYGTCEDAKAAYSQNGCCGNPTAPYVPLKRNTMEGPTAQVGQTCIFFGNQSLVDKTIDEVFANYQMTIPDGGSVTVDHAFLNGVFGATVFSPSSTMTDYIGVMTSSPTFGWAGNKTTRASTIAKMEGYIDGVGVMLIELFPSACGYKVNLENPEILTLFNQVFLPSFMSKVSINIIADFDAECDNQTIGDLATQSWAGVKTAIETKGGIFELNKFPVIRNEGPAII